MTGGRDLLGDQGQPARRRGRPPGAKNRRAADLKGWVEAKTGSSAAMQSAQLCLVTLKELKAAGGDQAAAVMAKAAGHVAAFDVEAEKVGAGLRSIVRQELALLLVETRGLGDKAVLGLVSACVDRLQAPGGLLTLRQALGMIADERRALLPYTDQKQPQQLAVKGEGFAPVMVMVGGSATPPQETQRNQRPALDVPFEVLPSRSHDEGKDQ